MNAGNPPSNAILKMGVRPPIQRWHSHSEVKKNKPIPSPKIRMPISPLVSPNMPHPRTRSGQSSGHESNCMLCQMSPSEGMWARLTVLVSSRHNGPAFIAVSTSSMLEKAVPISAAAVSIPGFGIRFNDIALRFDRPNCRPSITDSEQGGEIRSPDSTQALKQEHAGSSCGIGRRSYGATPFNRFRCAYFVQASDQFELAFAAMCWPQLVPHTIKSITTK